MSDSIEILLKDEEPIENTDPAKTAVASWIIGVSAFSSMSLLAFACSTDKGSSETMESSIVASVSCGRSTAPAASSGPSEVVGWLTESTSIAFIDCRSSSVMVWTFNVCSGDLAARNGLLAIFSSEGVGPSNGLTLLGKSMVSLAAAIVLVFSGELRATDFVGEDGGLRAGDWSNEAFVGDLMATKIGFIALSARIPLFGDSCSSDAFIGVRDGRSTGCAILSPKFSFTGEFLRLSLKGDGGGRRAGLDRMLDDTFFVVDDGAKLNFETLFTSFNGLIGRFVGDLLRALIGVFSLASSSSLMGSDLAIWTTFLGDNGKESNFSASWTSFWVFSTPFLPRVVAARIVAGFRTGFAFNPAGFLADGFGAAVPTGMFSLSTSSSNLTFFLVVTVVDLGAAVFVADFDVVAASRPRVAFVTWPGAALSG